MCDHLRLAALKETSQYGDSVQQAQERCRPAQSSAVDKEDRERQIMEQKQQQKQIQDQLQFRDGQVKEKDAVIATREQQIQQLEQVTQEVNAQFQQDLRQREKMIQELLEEKQHLQQELGKVSQQRIVTQKGRLILSLCNC